MAIRAVIETDDGHRVALSADGEAVARPADPIAGLAENLAIGGIHIDGLAEEAPVWFKHRAWIPVAWVLSVINLGAAWFAARTAEPAHATLHALLAVACALGAQRLTARQRADVPSEQLQQTLDQNEQLQRTIDDMQARALELEERLDAAEHLLARHRESDRLGEPPR